MKRFAIAAGLLFLSGCGAREQLKPREGASLPVAPYGAKEQPNSAALLKPPVETRPARSDSLIESTDERRSDEFDLPPPN